MIKNYLKIAFRGFWKHKMFTMINIVGLSIGISAALVIYLIVHFDFTFDNFHDNGDRIYRVVTNLSFQGTPVNTSGVCGPLPAAAKSQVGGIEVAAPFFTLFRPNVFIPSAKGVPVKLKNQDNIILADGQYFKLFNYKWLAGSSQNALSEPHKVVLSSQQAKKYFPGLSYDQIIGKTVNYDTTATTVSGIVQTPTQNSDLTFHDFISYSTAYTVKDFKDQLQFTDWNSTNSDSQLYIKIASATSVSRVEKQLNDIFQKSSPPTTAEKGNTHLFKLQPLNDIHFNNTYAVYGDGRVANKTTLYGLLVIALFLLVLGCINFINLTTAQATQRAKEIGIRKTMGSSRKQLIFQFLSETFLITLFAVIISVALTPIILKLFADFIPAGVNANFTRPNVILFLIFLTLTVSFLSGFYPALILSGYKPIKVLKKQHAGHGSNTRNATLRKSLTVTQFVIAQVFIMATILVTKQIYYALHKDLGFKKDAIVIINTPVKNRQENAKKVFFNKLQAIPQIELISKGREAPASYNINSKSITYRDGKKEVKTEVERKFGDENYIKVYHIKLLAGRNLQPGDTSRATLINNTYAHILGFSNPHDAVGKQLDGPDGNKKMEIVGVTADFHQTSLHKTISPIAIITSTNTAFNGTFHIALKPKTPNGDEWKEAIASMQSAWKQLYPDEDFEYHFFDENIAGFYENEQHTSTLLSWATALSIFISCLGLLGLAIYTTNQRTKEIGIRKTLGASVTQIVTLLSTELISLIILAFVIATPVAWWAMNKWMQGFADRTPISWWIFVVSGSAILFTAVFTSGFQTVKAAIASPVKSLRSE